MPASSSLFNLRGGINPTMLHPTAGSTTHRLKVYCSVQRALKWHNKNASLCHESIKTILTETARHPTLPEVLTSRRNERRAQDAAQRRSIEISTAGEPYFHKLYRLDRPARFSTPVTRHHLPLSTARSAYAERLRSRDMALLSQVSELDYGTANALRSMSSEVNRLVDALKQHYHSFDEFDSVAQGLLQILPETAPIFRHHLYEWGGERPFRAHDGNDIHWDLEKTKELLRSFYEYVEGQTLTYPGFITIVEAFDAFFVAADISFPFGTPGARARFREDWRANYAAEEDRAQNGAVIQAPCEIDDRSSADIDMDDPKPDIQPNSSPWQDNDNISSASTDPPSHLSFSALAPYTKSSTVSSAQSFRHIAQNPVSMPSASPITASLYAPISLKTLPSKPLKSATLASRTCLHTSTPPSFAPLVSAVPSSSSPTALPDSNGTSVVDDASLAKKGKQRARTATADSGYACPETSTSGSATATLGNAAPVSAADIPRTAILSTSEEDIKSGTGVFAPSPLYSSTRLKAMFAHSDFGGLCHTSRLTLEKRITNRLHPDCPENTFLRRACEYFSKNTVTKWQLLQDSFDIVNFRNSMHMLRRKTLKKCPLSTFHHKSAELSQAIKDMELWFQGIKLGHDQAPRKVAPIKKRGV